MKELKFLIIIKQREEETERRRNREKKPKGRHFLGCSARVILSQVLHHRELRFRRCRKCMSPEYTHHLSRFQAGFIHGWEQQ